MTILWYCAKLPLYFLIPSCWVKIDKYFFFALVKWHFYQLFLFTKINWTKSGHSNVKSVFYKITLRTVGLVFQFDKLSLILWKLESCCVLKIWGTPKHVYAHFERFILKKLNKIETLPKSLWSFFKGLFHTVSKM